LLICEHPEGCEKLALSKSRYCATHAVPKSTPGVGTKAIDQLHAAATVISQFKICNHPDGCKKKAEIGGSLCKAHKISKRMCKHPDGCNKWALVGGLCISHGAVKVKINCKHPEGCQKWAVKGGFCKAHAHTDVQAAIIMLKLMQNSE